MVQLYAMIPRSPFIMRMNQTLSVILPGRRVMAMTIRTSFLRGERNGNFLLRGFNQECRVLPEVLFLEFYPRIQHFKSKSVKCAQKEGTFCG
jgi:hypothetical protein